MRLFYRLVPNKPLSKPLLAFIIALIATMVVVVLEQSYWVRSLNENPYDKAYDLRRSVGGRESPVVIVAATEASLRAMATGQNKWGWPWPRQMWGLAIKYVQDCGAKGAAVDLLFPEPSQYNGELGDDSTFAEILDGLKIPVIQAVQVNGDGGLSPFAPPVKRPPVFGSVNLVDGATVREYLSTFHGTPSLALQAVRALGSDVPPWGTERFRLHYYGHSEDAKGRTTFPYVAASDLFEAMRDPQHPQKYGIDPALFKGKIVLFGTTAAGAHDVKSSPLDPIYPGVEVHATAVENLLKYQRVRVVPPLGLAAVTALAAAATAIGAATPKRTWLKLLLSGLVALDLLIVVGLLFRMNNIVWLPPVGPLAGIGLSVLLSLSWSYFAEDRQARFFLRALGQYVSPQVAAELKSDPKKLAISTAKGDLTILFSDIVGFTDLSEQLDERVGPLLNYYLDEMSQPVLAEDGTVDKYIGDAIMSFWNAPVPQADHAVRACRTALAMQRRLKEIQPQLAELGAPGMAARIGINTGMCAYGNMGSRSKFNYSVIGDPCNFASRLEGANKLYDTHILVGEGTAKVVREQFVLRKVDVLRVKGKLKPQAIFELIGAGTADATMASLISRYEAAFSHYCQGNWDLAEKFLLELLAAVPDDGPSKQLLSRVSVFRQHPPTVPWDGVFVAKEK